MAEIDVILRAKVDGTAEIAALNKQLAYLNDFELTQNRAQLIARDRRARNIALMQREMQIKGNLIGADEQATFLEARYAVENRNRNTLLMEQNELMQRAVVLQVEHNLTVKKSIDMAKQERENNLLLSRVKTIMNQEAEDVDNAFMKRKAEMMALDQADKKAKADLLKIDNNRRQELMQASIGMFVMGITMTQTLATMEKMAGTGTVLAGVFKEMGQAVKFILGPIQVVTAAMQFLEQKNKQLMVTMIKTMGIFVGMYLLYTAFTTKSRELRAVLGFVGGALIAYNALLLINTARTWYNLQAKAALISLESLGAALPSIILAIGAGLAVGIAAYATAPKGQNVPGYSRPVNNTGLVYAHRGETISRIGSSGPDSRSGSIVNIFVPENSIVNTDMVDYMTRSFEIIQASGRGG